MPQNPALQHGPWLICWRLVCEPYIGPTIAPTSTASKRKCFTTESGQIWSISYSAQTATSLPAYRLRGLRATTTTTQRNTPALTAPHTPRKAGRAMQAAASAARGVRTSGVSARRSGISGSTPCKAAVREHCARIITAQAGAAAGGRAPVSQAMARPYRLEDVSRFSTYSE